MDELDIERIIETYDVDCEFRISTAYGDGGLHPLNERLGRAALNQLANAPATVSRYAIWANTVRDTIVAAQRELGSDTSDSVRRLLYRAANSLSAFSEIQAQLDPMVAGNLESLPPAPYHRPANKAPLNAVQKSELLAKYFEHYQRVAKQKPDELNAKVPRKAFRDLLDQVGNLLLAKSREAAVADGPVRVFLDQHPVPDCLDGHLPDDFRAFCLALNALKQWLAAEQAATDRYLLGSRARELCRHVASTCVVTGEPLAGQTVELHHPARDGRPPIPLSKVGHARIEEQTPKDIS